MRIGEARMIVCCGAIAMLLAGCTTYRAIEVKTARSGAPNGLSDSQAIRLLQDLAGQLHFPVEGPIRVSHDLTEYAASTNVQYSPDRTTLILWIDRGEYRFEVSIYGRKEDIGKAQELAGAFTKALSDRGLAYKIETATAIPPTGP